LQNKKINKSKKPNKLLVGFISRFYPSFLKDYNNIIFFPCMMDYGGYFKMVLYINQCFAHYLGVWVVFLEDVKFNGVCNHVIFISF
jgi:hypothetical protein